MKKYKFKFDEYELGILINSLVEMRNQLIKTGKALDTIDTLILKIMK